MKNILNEFLISYPITNSPFINNMGSFNLEIKNYGQTYQIYPNSLQKQIIFDNFDASRFVYNKTLEDNIFSYKELGVTLTPLVTDLKDRYFFLCKKTIDSLALANAQQNLKKAWKKFYNHEASFPCFKSKKYKKSYTTNNQHGSIRFFDDNFLQLPKLGKLKFKNYHNNNIDTKNIKNATISMVNNKFFVSICFEQIEWIPIVNPITKDNNIHPICSNIPKYFFDNFLGLDFSCESFYIDSFGNSAEFDNPYLKNLNQLKKEQKKLSKMEFNSNNYNKQKLKLSKLHKKIENQRKDFLHKLSTKLSNEFLFIVVEDLNLQSMSKCLNLGKSIMSKGFGMFRSFLSYKLDKRGGQLITIDKWYASSKTCHICGYKKTDLKLSDREWICPICNTYHNRDNNAAINIKMEGIRQYIAAL